MSFGATCTATGGWSFKEKSTDAQTALPVTLRLVSPPDCGGSCETLGCLFPSATNTGNGSVSASFSASGGTIPASQTQQSCSVTLMPNNPRDIWRVNADDYGALWFRGGFPRTHHLAFCHGGLCTDTGPANVDTIEHEWQAHLLSNVLGEAHVIEDPMSEDVKAPYDFLSLYIYNSGTPATSCSEKRGAHFPDIVHGVDDLQVLETLKVPTTGGAIGCYANTWAAPHWSYLYFWPAVLGDTDPGTPDDWTVDGGRQNPDVYWLPARTQWMHNSALPSGEETRKRNFIIDAPLWDGALGPYIQAQFLANTNGNSWVGNSRFKVLDPGTIDSYTYDATTAAAWSTDALKATASFASGGITLTPVGGHTSFDLKLALNRFTERPYMYPSICDRFHAKWESANISSVSVYVGNAHGDEALLGSTNDTTWPLPLTAQDSKYAGSWAQDYSIGSVSFDDAGTDDRPAGESVNLPLFADRIAAFELLAGQSAAYVRFAVTVTSADATCQIDWPTCYASESAVTVVQENGHWSNLIWPDGPGVRQGQWQWWDGSELLQEPGVQPIGSVYSIGSGDDAEPYGHKNSAIDMLCWANVVCQGQARDTGFTSLLPSLYDSVVGNAVADVDDLTVGYCLPPGESLGSRAGLIALVNSWAELPPNCVFPTRARDGNWQETGSYVQESWTYCQLPRRIVSAKAEAHMFMGATQWTATSTLPTVSSWAITEHSHAVDNTESGAKIVYDSVNYATVRPWWGWSAILTRVPAPGDVANLHGSFGNYITALADASGVLVKSSEFGAPEGAWITSSVPITDPMNYVHLMEDLADNSVLLMASDGTTCHRKRSWNAGTDWEDQTPMTGVKFERGASTSSGVHTVLGLVKASMTLKGEVMDLDSLSYGSAFTVTDADGSSIVLQEEPFDISGTRDRDDALILKCWVSGDSGFSEWMSANNGRSFWRV